MTAALKRLRIVLVEPQIPANVGNIARTVKAIGGELFLIRPLGFQLDQKKLKRGSVGYWDDIPLTVFRDAEDFWSQLEVTATTTLVFATKHGDEIYTDVNFSDDVIMIFGSEDAGVPQSFWSIHFPEFVKRTRSCRIPMGEVRCLNLATSVGVMAYEVVRQRGLVVAEPKMKSSNQTGLNMIHSQGELRAH